MVLDPNTTIDDAGDASYTPEYQDQQDQYERQQAGLTPAPAALQQTAPGVYSPTAPTAPTPRTGITRRPRFNPMDYEVDKDAPGLQFRPETVEQHPGWWHDMGQAIWQGTLSQGKDVVDAAQFAAQQMGADPTIRQHIKDASGVVNDEIKSSIASMDPKRQAALSASWMSMFNGNNVDTNGVKIPSPGEVGYFNYFSTNIAQLVPTVLTAILPASLVGKMGIKALSMLGMATKATDAVTGAVTATRAATAARTALQAGTTGSIFGAEGTGQMFDFVQQQLANMKPEQKMNSPIYAEIVNKGGTDADGSEAMLRASAPYIYGYGALSGIAGVGVGGIVAGKLGAAGLGRVASAALGGAEGAVTMGAQGAGEAATQQAIQNQQGQRQGYDFNAILANAASQGMPGLVLGAGFGALHGHPAEAKKPSPPQGDIDPATQSALAAAGIYSEPAGPKEIAGPPSPPQGQLDLGSAPPGPPAGSPQGEMFPTVQEANRPTNTVGTGLTEAPTPTPPPGPADQQAGMVGARQQELPINQTPPAMVAATGQGEMFPSLPEANPPVAQVTPFRGDEPPPPPPGTPPPGGGGGAPAATQAAVKTSQAKTPPPAGQRPSGTMKKAELNDALVGMGIDTKGMNRDDMARRFDREQARAPSTPTPPDTTVTEGPPTAPARETAPAGPVAETQAAPSVPGALTPPAPEGTREAPGDIAAAFGKMGGALSASLRDMLWAKHEAGDTTEAGAPSNILRASAYLKSKGMLTDRASFDQFVNDFGKAQKAGEIKTQAGFKKFLDDRVKPEPTADISTGVRPEGGAPPVTDERPAGATAEQQPVTPGVTPEEKESPRETAVGHLAAAKQRVLAEARANGAPVRRGSPAEKAINAAMEEMQRAFSDPKQDPGDVMKMLHTDARRGTPNEGETIAAYAARRALVSGMLKEITGNEKFKLPPLKLKEVADTRSEIEQVRAEEQQRGGEEATRKATTSEATEEKATGASETGETTGAEAVDEKLPKGTSIPVKAKALVKQILDPQHAMDVPTAEKILAKTSNLGRPRTKGFGDLHDAFETEWKRITGEVGQKAKAKLEAELAKLDRQQPMTEEGTQGRVLEEQQHDRAVAKVQKQLEEYAPERLIAMAKAMKEIADPIKDAADKREALVARAAEIKGETPGIPLDAPLNEGISPRSSRYVTGSADPRLGANYEAMFGDRIRGSGAPVMAREAATMIAQDPMVRAEQGPLREVAERFARLLPADVPIMSLERAMREGRIKQGLFNDLRSRNVYGAYDPESRTILHNIDGPRVTGSHVETALHEMSHAISYHYLNALERADKFHPDLRVLNAIRSELRDHVLAESKSGILTEQEVQRLIKAIGNNHELHTQMFTDPVVHGFASARKASQGLLDTLRSLGHPGSPGQSVWRSFANWVRKATGQGPAKSASEFTLFDHIIKPVTDIQDRAAEYNKQNVLPKDPGLYEHASPVYDGITASMGDRTRNMLERMDPAGMGDRFRRTVMGVVNRDAFVDWNKDVQPGLVDWRTADENIRARSNEFAAKYGDKVQELLGRIHKADNKDNLSNLMVDVGIHEAHVGSGLTAAEQLVNARSPEAANLQRVYDKLSPKDRALYDDVKDLNKRMYADERAAQVESLIHAYMPDATPEQQEAFRTGVKSEGSLEKFLNDPENSDIARAFGDKWATERQIATGMARLHGMGFVHGDYFPLRRFGNYVVRYGDEKTPANYGVEMFDSYTKANQRRAELIRSGRTDVLQVARKDDTHLSNLTSKPAFADELSSAMKRKGYDAAQIEHVNDLMNDILLRHATHSEAARAQLSRRGVRGASTDQTRVLSADFLSKQMRIGYMAHGLDRARRLGEMRDQVAALERSPTAAPGAAVRAMSIYQEAAKRMTRPEEHDNILRRVGATANAFSFVQSLMSVSHMLTSTLETHGNSMALLGARYGYTRTALALSRALADASPALAGGARNTIKALGNRLKTSDWNMLQAVIDEMKSKPGSDPRLLDMLGKEAVRTGIIDHTYLQDIRQSMSPAGNIGTGAQKMWNMFYNSNAAMAHAVDVTNKLGVLTAVARMEMRRPGVTREQAVAQAIQMTRRVMPNYTVGNRERIASGPIGSTLLQFKRYGMHMYALMGNLINESMHGPNKAESMKALAGILGTHAAMAGVLTLIADPLRYIGGAYDIATGAPKFHDYQNDVRSFLASTFGPQVAEIMARGLPHAMGMDLHRRVGLANLLEVPEMDGFNKQGAAQVLLGLATGATGENLQNLVDGASKFLHGDWGGTMKAMAPRPFRDIYKGIDAATEGIKDSTGKVIVSPDKVGVSGAITQALGIQPSQVSEFREKRAAILEARQEQSATHTQLSNAWLANPAKRSEIWQKIQAFNRDNRGVAITRDQLMRTLNQRRKDDTSGSAGLRLPRKGAQQLIQAGAFANVQ